MFARLDVKLRRGGAYMKKETLLKLLLLFGVGSMTIKHAMYLRVTIDEVEEMEYHVYEENEGRIDL